MIIQGTVRRVNDYSDGAPSLEIHIHKKYESDLPILKNDARPILIEIDGQKYETKLRHTDQNEVIWISPRCELDGEVLKLSDILTKAGFQNKDTISMDIQSTITVLPKA